MIKIVTIGASYGGLEAIKTILSSLPPEFNIPVVIVLHIGNNKISTYISLLNNKTHFNVKEAEEKEPVKSGTVYFAPPNYHLQLEENSTLSLSTAEKVNYSRPSIDVLFETAAWAYKSELLGILLTGSNSDGASGIKTIKEYGGITIVENPETAFAKTMPGAAVAKANPDYILDLTNIADKINELCM